MKAKLIIINWLFAWALLCYRGDNPAVAAIIIVYFGATCWLFKCNEKAVAKEIKQLENKLIKLIKL